MGKTMSNILGVSITKILCIMMVSIPSLLQAKEREVELINTDKHFIETVATLRKSVTIKDPFPILRAVASDFKIERDFGGLFNQDENAVVNFLIVFPLDELDVSEEYQGAGWQQLKNILQSKMVIERNNMNLCLPNGRYQNDIVLDEMLCFTQAESGIWKVSSFVNAGD
jgi:hypothetical protein